MQDTLRITEVFYSLQGETRTAGLPTVFVRLTGCPLRCQYCDSAYAFSGGTVRPLDSILEQVAGFRPRYVCVTGGEPLAQPNAIALMDRLLSLGYEISLETAGALSVKDVPAAVSKVMDLKTPSSGEVDKNLWENLDYLTCHDQLKIVIADRADYDWAVDKLHAYELDKKVGTVWFSPMFDVHTAHKGEVPNIATQLAEWILADGLPVRFGLQLHKIIWADAKGK